MKASTLHVHVQIKCADMYFKYCYVLDAMQTNLIIIT